MNSNNIKKMNVNLDLFKIPNVTRKQKKPKEPNNKIKVKSNSNNNIAASEFNWFYSLPSTQTYSINVVGYNYYYDLNGSDRGGIVSGNDARVDLNTGDNVNFNVSMNSGNHPFFIKNSSNNNVTLDSGTQGTINSTLSWTPSVSGTYYYICGAHSSMRGDIIVS